MPSNLGAMSEKRKEWFGEWFDTIYYHILYKHRDYEEAAEFLDALLERYHIPPHTKVLDLACGKGRHSIYLHNKGLDVTGVDLSANSIEFANRSKTDTLNFEIHDMRNIYRPEGFDYIFNLFTSFGYFDTKEENLKVFDATIASLKKGGKLIFDFLNPYVVINNLVEKEDKTIENIHFQIEREYTPDEFIIKKITVDDHGQHYDFYEKVKAIRRLEFLAYFEKLGLTVLDVLGDYHLNEYDSKTSQRLIFVVQKNG